MTERLKKCAADFNRLCSDGGPGSGRKGHTTPQHPDGPSPLKRMIPSLGSNPVPTPKTKEERLALAKSKPPLRSYRAT